MGVLSTIASFLGFGMGTSLGLVIGYYMFIYFQPTDVKDPTIRPLVDLDSKTLQQMLPEIPSWIKNPDYDGSGSPHVEIQHDGVMWNISTIG